ncbi:MAG: hypothetical protein WAU91_08225 [Desulfatitalea sp.]
MFEIDYPPKHYRSIAFNLLKIITIICILNATTLLIVKAKPFYFFAFLFPLAISGISNLIFGVLILFNMRMHHRTESSIYIIQKYPSIWKKLHPWGKYSHNFVAYWNFLKGKYDLGEDIKLEAIRKNESEKLNFLLWINLLPITSWALNVLLLIVKKNF